MTSKTVESRVLGSLGADITVTRIKTAYEQVVDQLRDLIVSGGLQPGDRLPVEGKLAATFGVSRGTVREALRVLAAQNLVYTSRGVAGGTFIADASPGLLSSYLETGLSLLSGTDQITPAEVLEARELIEVPATRLAAQRRTEEQLQEMRAAVDHEMTASSRGGRFEHNSRFHAVVLEAAGNRLVEVLTLPMFGVIRKRFLRDDAPSRFWSQVDQDHLAILQHLEAGDADVAAETMRDHLAKLRAVYEGDSLSASGGTAGSRR